MVGRTLRTAAAALAVAVSALALAASSAWADPPACPSGTPASVVQQPSGGPGNGIFGGFYFADEFVAKGSTITRLSAWFVQAANAPITFTVIEGTAIGGTVVGSATAPGGATGKVEATPARPIAVRAGETYLLKVGAPTATRGLVQLISSSGRFWARDGSHGNTDYSATGWDMGMQLDFCGAGVGGCTIGAPGKVLQDSVGGPGNAIFRSYYLGDAFTARGTSITQLAVWIADAADAPVTLSVIEGTAIGGPVVGSATLAAGVRGKATATFARPLAVRDGADYILKVNASGATRGTAELIGAPGGWVYARDGSSGGGDYRASGWEMAMEVDFCGGGITYDTQPPTSGDFGPVHGSDVAAESFTALDGTLYDASVWLTEANDGPLSVTVRSGTPSGPVVASAALDAGPTGKRSVVFRTPAALIAGSRYVLAIGTGSVETHTGRVAKRADDPSQQGYDVSGPVARDMALDLTFGPALAPPRAMTSDECVVRLSFPAGYERAVNTALTAKPDIWGTGLIGLSNGPTYDNVKDYLLPLRYVGSPAGVSGNQLTDSGVFYIPMWAAGADTFGQTGALHVADGSQIASGRPTGRRITTYVGADGRERYGLCEAMLEEPALADGYQPVLQVAYRDVDGVAYTQESFVAWLPGTRTPASFVKLTAQRGSSSLNAVELKIATGDSGLSDAGGAITNSGGDVAVYDGAGWTLAGGSTLRSTVDLSSGAVQTRYLVRPVTPAAPTTFMADATSHATALSGLKTAWDAKLATGARYSVPEQRVMDAQRNLLIQNLQLNWRYSYGNAYESFYQPESSSAVHRLAEYGFEAEARAGLQSLLPSSHGIYRTWERGEKLSHAAAYWFLTRDDAFIAGNRATYLRYLADMAAERAANSDGLLPKEPEGGDIPVDIYGTHAQTVAWRGIRDIALVGSLMGDAALAAYASEAAAYGRALRRAIDSSKRTVGSSTFIPHDLLNSAAAAFDPITGTKIGSYWNLLHPYALASGFFDPAGSEADSVWRYSRDEGALLLGLQRFNYYGTAVGAVVATGLPGYKTTGDDNVYAVERVRFLAAKDDPDQLVLGLYGKLAHGMTRKTFVAGEGHTIGPARGEYFRSMYLPPNNANNDLFLVTLREMLVHVAETTGGEPAALRLAHATPRGWLEDGKAIDVAGAPTPFGAVSYRVESSIATRRVDVTATLPASAALRAVRLRLRLPAGQSIASARVVGSGRAVAVSGETLDLTGMTGAVTLQVDLR